MKNNQYDKIFEKNVMFVSKLYLSAKLRMESVNIAVGTTIDSERQTRTK